MQVHRRTRGQGTQNDGHLGPGASGQVRRVPRSEFPGKMGEGHRLPGPCRVHPGPRRTAPPWVQGASATGRGSRGFLHHRLPPGSARRYRPPCRIGRWTPPSSRSGWRPGPRGSACGPSHSRERRLHRCTAASQGMRRISASLPTGAAPYAGRHQEPSVGRSARGTTGPYVRRPRRPTPPPPRDRTALPRQTFPYSLSGSSPGTPAPREEGPSESGETASQGGL